jgi:hypothetical protein
MVIMVSLVCIVNKNPIVIPKVFVGFIVDSMSYKIIAYLE